MITVSRVSNSQPGGRGGVRDFFNALLESFFSQIGLKNPIHTRSIPSWFSFVGSAVLEPTYLADQGQDTLEQIRKRTKPSAACRAETLYETEFSNQSMTYDASMQDLTPSPRPLALRDVGTMLGGIFTRASPLYRPIG